tara:strand:- start:2097 stop:3170 length:1074 start_codon:yes stop_codon:yes gene_type:complete
MRSRSIHSVLQVIASVFAILVATVNADAQIPEVFHPAGPAAESIADLFWLVIAVCSVIFLVVTGTLIVFIHRFRERADDGETEPPQLYGSQPIELAWTVAPLMIVLVLALVVIRSVVDLRGEPPAQNAERVRVVGHQWWWEFEYPQHGFTTANELVIPVSDEATNRPVYLQLESADVIHSFWVPRLAGKTDLIPGKTNQMWIQADQEGTFAGRCAEYCGTQHAKMLIRVRVVSPADYATWISHQQQNALPPSTERPAESPSETKTTGALAGHARFMELACANCHTIGGTHATGKFGPDLTHLMSRETLAAGIMDNDREHLTRWIKDPNLDKSGCRMPDMRLSDTDVKQIVDYMITLE